MPLKLPSKADIRFQIVKVSDLKIQNFQIVAREKMHLY